MNFKRNQLMLTLLGGDPEYTEPSSEPIPEALIRVLAEGFEVIDGCILLRSLASARSSLLINLKFKDDETAIEAAINEIHVQDFTTAEISFSELARLGCDFGFALSKRIADEAFNQPFRVIVAARPADPTCTVRSTCVVRFHKRRNHQSWLDDDLENYREEAIEVMDS